jgi:UDP-2-acetamido-3-amino-2,3-dideoxy-glucuronate N-acetyltransferase
MEGVKINIALIGAGPWGKNHLKNLVELGVLHSVVEKSKKRLKELRESYPSIHFKSDDSSILDDPDIRGVVLAVPSALHYTLSKKYLLAGKDVLVEKPLSLTVAEGQELVELAERKKQILMVGHILQYHPAILRLRSLISNNDLGEIRYIYSNRLNIGKLRSEENVLWSFAPHDISLILMLMGYEDPLRVSAFGGAYVNRNIFDTTLTILEFKNRVMAHIFVSWLHPYKEQKLVVVGSKKMALFDDLSAGKLFIYPHEIRIEDGKIPVAHKADFITIPLPQKQPLEEELKHFIHCVETRAAPRTDAKEGLMVLKILEKAEQNLRDEFGK